MFLPHKLKIGFQKRTDTYTNKLSYIIYYNEKNKLCKEASFNSWIDKSIATQELDNVPTEGFVINKTVGNYKTDWNFRQGYFRIYDPRGFEFEITIANMISILMHNSTNKGGLIEGSFVYGWEDSKLVLLSTNTEEYKSLTKISDTLHSKNHITGSNLKIGATYKTKDNKTLVYMGRFDVFGSKYKQIPLTEEEKKDWIDKAKLYRSYYSVPDTKGVYVMENTGKHYYFVELYIYAVKTHNINKVRLKYFKTIGNSIIECVDENCTSEYSNYFDMLEHDPNFSPKDDSKNEKVLLDKETFIREYPRDYYANRFRFEGFEEKSTDYYYGFNLLKDDYYTQKRPELQKFIGKYYIKGSIPVTEDKYFTLDEIYNKYKPYYIRYYLTNGKLYVSGLGSEQNSINNFNNFNNFNNN